MSIEDSSEVPQVWRLRSEGSWTSHNGCSVNFLGGRPTIFWGTARPFQAGTVLLGVSLSGAVFLSPARDTFRAVTLWPWLSGRPADIDLFRLAITLTAFAILLLSWNYVKAVNRAAAEALQREINQETAKTPPVST